jgi:hypothetical protein
MLHIFLGTGEEVEEVEITSTGVDNLNIAVKKNAIITILKKVIKDRDDWHNRYDESEVTMNELSSEIQNAITEKDEADAKLSHQKGLVTKLRKKIIDIEELNAKKIRKSK